MLTLTLKDLCVTDELDRKALETVHGGRGRTASQILSHELTGLPATSDGLVLGYDGQLHLATGPMTGPTL